jgi:hypothetical protein
MRSGEISGEPMKGGSKPGGSTSLKVFRKRGGPMAKPRRRVQTWETARSKAGEERQMRECVERAMLDLVQTVHNRPPCRV